MKKLSRKEIAEGLEQVPIERVLLGAASPNGVKLTPKQKAFAHQVVETGNKTEAYRRAYDHKGKSKTAARSAQKVASQPAVSTYIAALEAYKAAQEYLLPARLREMAIQKLASLALNDEVAPAQQLKALELVGKMSEVALFSERREVVHSVDSSSLKDQLLAAVQAAINNSGSLRSSAKRSAAQLLEEIQAEDVQAVEIKQLPGNDPSSQEAASISQEAAQPQENQENRPPASGHPPNCPDGTAEHLHSISDTQLSEKTGVGGIQNPQWVEVGTDIRLIPIKPNSK